MVKSMVSDLSNYLRNEWKAISYVFLGVFLLLFGLNLTAMLSFMPSRYSALSFDMSVFTSIFAIVYIVYTLHEK